MRSQILEFNAEVAEDTENNSKLFLRLLHVLCVEFLLLFFVWGCAKPAQKRTIEPLHATPQTRDAVKELRSHLDAIFANHEFANAFWGVAIQSLDSVCYEGCGPSYHAVFSPYLSSPPPCPLARLIRFLMTFLLADLAVLPHRHTKKAPTDHLRRMERVSRRRRGTRQGLPLRCTSGMLAEVIRATLVVIEAGDLALEKCDR